MTARPEFVTNVTHEPDCTRPDDRGALFLYRQTAHTQTAEFYEHEDGERISTDIGEWKFDELLEPVEIQCSSCDASRYVVIDKHKDVVAMTPQNCVRATFSGSHYYGGGLPCKYCGYDTEKR